ncbi:MAG: hypothetical protein HY080_14645 [Gammaproteobacteria bacterium]|nr:hypothetical protein [Gammaproteobacteria bacterium]
MNKLVKKLLFLLIAILPACALKIVSQEFQPVADAKWKILKENSEEFASFMCAGFKLNAYSAPLQNKKSYTGPAFLPIFETKQPVKYPELEFYGINSYQRNIYVILDMTKLQDTIIYTPPKIALEYGAKIFNPIKSYSYGDENGVLNSSPKYIYIFDLNSIDIVEYRINFPQKVLSCEVGSLKYKKHDLIDDRNFEFLGSP